MTRQARERYRISPTDLGSESSRALALAIARVDEDNMGGGQPSVSAGELDATRVLCRLFAQELERLDRPGEASLDGLEQELGREGLEALLATFAQEYGDDSSEPPRWSECLRLLLLVFWLNHNPATASMRRLFDDRHLARKAPYRRAIELLLGGEVPLPDAASEESETGVGPAKKGSGRKSAPREETESEDREPRPSEIDSLSKIAVGVETTPPLSDFRRHLEAPIDASPRSLAGQLESAIEQWTDGKTDEMTLRALDRLAEERPRFPHGSGPEGPVETLAPMSSWVDTPSDPLPFPSDVDSSDGFAPGRGSWRKRTLSMGGRRRTAARDESDWMRSLVLQTKHAHVWLAQLSERRGEVIDQLDDIPLEELEQLVADGATALWLIGVWERSAASREIKRRSGARDADASAYSIKDYTVAADLGGDAAMYALIERARTCGLRIAVDVVPNHVGIDSTWVQEHPERLLSVEECPFPGYDFDTPDLSSKPEVGLFLERGYYDRSDAAVVFRRLDRQTGEERFVYHGNDGTGLPWNDTAQLDYTNPSTRSAMTELILEQARRFPILRFDAAMTLTRLHYQRLWFPQPGDGGAIPSRSAFGWSNERFEQAVPEEFWRQVTQRVAEERLDTLLIAEAFWLMEPFFVRDLDMHRVYNSSFMHLLRRREASRFRQLLERSLATDPGMVSRSVFYATNADEEPAALQFGRGDRYFGVMSLLAVLPATALLGHGQIEGLGEKYGMEYLRASSQEKVDQEMVERHRREIVPLLSDRGLVGADEVKILRLMEDSGRLCEDVLAVLRGSGADTIIVAFNNSERAVRGHLVVSPDLSGLNRLIDEVIDPVELERLEQQQIEAAESRWLAEVGAGGAWLIERLALVDPALEKILYWQERSGGEHERSVEEISTQGVSVALGPEQTIVLSGFGTKPRRGNPVAEVEQEQGSDQAD